VDEMKFQTSCITASQIIHFVNDLSEQCNSHKTITGQHVLINNKFRINIICYVPHKNSLSLHKKSRIITT